MKTFLLIFILTLYFIISGCQSGSYKNQSTLDVSAKEESSVTRKEVFQPKEEPVEARFNIGDDLFITNYKADINDIYGFKGNLVRQGKFEEKVKVIQKHEVVSSFGDPIYWYQVEMADGKIGWAHEIWIGDRADVEEAMPRYDELIRREKERKAKEEARKAKIEWERQAPQRRRQAFVDENPNLSNTIKELILSGKIIRGMTPEQVKASWGEPDRINSSYGSYGSREQWIYYRQNLYFRDGHLDSWQEFGR